MEEKVLSREPYSGHYDGKLDSHPFGLDELKGEMEMIRHVVNHTSPNKSKDQMKRDASINDELIDFLTMISLQKASLNIVDKEMQELFLPYDLTKQGHYYISLRETTSILQNELNLKVARREELILLNEYANSEGEINAMLLLKDLGSWTGDYYESDGNLSPSTSSIQPEDSPTTSQQMGKNFNDSLLPRESLSSPAKQDNYVDPNQFSPKKSKDTRHHLFSY